MAELVIWMHPMLLKGWMSGSYFKGNSICQVRNGKWTKNFDVIFE